MFGGGKTERRKDRKTERQTRSFIAGIVVWKDLRLERSERRNPKSSEGIFIKKMFTVLLKS
jgi:hypothetical protein